MSDTTAVPEAVSMGEMDALLERVRKLEATVEELRDTKSLETRIVKRLRARRDPVEEPGEESRPTEPVVEPAPPPPVYQLGPEPLRSRWLLFDMFSEFKNMFGMLFDMRFRIGWPTRVVVIVILCVMMTGDWWMFPINVIPFGFGMKVVNLILGFILFKIVTWETRRYVAQRQV